MTLPANKRWRDYGAMLLGLLTCLTVANAKSDGKDLVQQLDSYLLLADDKRPPLLEQAFVSQPLSKEQCAAAQKLLWEAHVKKIVRERALEMKRGAIEVKGKGGKLIMPFVYRRFGKRIQGKKTPLVISMHGGGGGSARMNDQQWENQKRLYQLKEGIYLVPRAPTNTWNLWHQAHIDVMFDRLIQNLIVMENVDPDRVYIMGYSAGGDGVFQLAPRLADRLAAAAMMAGHPNETSPLGLRNLPFTLHMGGKDAAYKRNQKAAEWQKLLGDLRKKDPGGYEHWVKIYPGFGHWMNRKDAAAIPWMMKFKRIALPEKIVWKQDDVTHERYYWLALEKDQIKPRSLIVAERKGQKVEIQSETAKSLRVRLNDDMMNLDEKVVVTFGKNQKAVNPERTIRVIAESIAEYGDPSSIFSAEISVTQ